MHTCEDEVFMLISGTCPAVGREEQMEMTERGIVYLPRNIPHSCRITFGTADLLMIATPGGIEGMFRHAGRDIGRPGPKTSNRIPSRWPRLPASTAKSSSVRSR
ncbi:hypothetical protein [Streptomyces sp. NPDC003393]